jgi:LAS superfamily LD-carboxypeptidase LdcB
MMADSGGVVKASDIASSQRSEAKNRNVGGVAGSQHLSGNAIDIHGPSGEWMKKNGPKYGWYLNEYDGSHGGHFEYRGS